MSSSTQLAVKLTTLFSLLVASLFAGLAPLIIDGISKLIIRKSTTKTETRSKILKCTNFVFTAMDCTQGFAAGILLGAGLLHLLPEASIEIREILEQWGASEQVLDYPWAMIVCIISMTILYFLDTVVVQLTAGIFQQRKKRKAKKAKPAKPALESPRGDSIKNGEVTEQDHTVASPNEIAISKPSELVEQAENCEQHDHQSHSHTEHEKADNPSSHHYHDHHNHTAEIASQVVSGIVLWLSLSAHSFFEGLGLGTTTDDTQMWSLFAAIVSHKLVESFACGVVIFRSMRDKTWVVIIFMILFALMTPVGIAIGIGISSVESSGFTFAQHLILSFASGAFLFVAIFEIMANHSHFEGESQEKDRARTACGKPLFNVFRFLFFAVGIVLSSVLKVFEMHDHGHEEH